MALINNQSMFVQALSCTGPRRTIQGLLRILATRCEPLCEQYTLSLYKLFSLQGSIEANPFDIPISNAVNCMLEGYHLQWATLFVRTNIEGATCIHPRVHKLRRTSVYLAIYLRKVHGLDLQRRVSLVITRYPREQPYVFSSDRARPVLR